MAAPPQEHQQLASISTPGLLTSAAATYTGPDGRRHAVIAVAVGIRAPAVHLPYTPISAADGAVPPPQSSPWALRSAAAPLSPGSRAAAAAGPAALGSAAPSLDPLPGLALHWGCSGGPGHRWSGPGAGWHTLPAVSYDAGVLLNCSDRGARYTGMSCGANVDLKLRKEWQRRRSKAPSRRYWFARRCHSGACILTLGIASG